MSKNAYRPRFRHVRPDERAGRRDERPDDPRDRGRDEALAPRRARQSRRGRRPAWLSLLAVVMVAYIPIGVGMYLGQRAVGVGNDPSPGAGAAAQTPSTPQIIVVGGAGQTPGLPMPYGYGPVAGPAGAPGFPGAGQDFNTAITERVKQEINGFMAERAARELLAAPDGAAASLPRSGRLADQGVQLAAIGAETLPGVHAMRQSASAVVGGEASLAAKGFSADGAANSAWVKPRFVPAGVAQSLRQESLRNRAADEWFNARMQSEIADQQEKVQDNPGAPTPSLADVLRRLAEASFAARQYDRTARIYAEMAALNMPLSNFELWRWYKAAELSNADPAIGAERGLQVLDLIRATDPDNTMVLAETARQHIVVRRFMDASNIYQRLIELEPGVRDWRLLRAKTLVWANEPREALPLVRKLHEETPQDWELRELLADLLLAAEQYDAALPFLEQLIQHSPNDQALRLRHINTLLAVGSFAEAVELLGPLAATYPDDQALRRKYADALAASKAFARASEQYAIYLQRNPEDVSTRLYYGQALQAAQSFDGAAREFAVVLENHPDNISVRYRRAESLMAGQKFAEGALEFRRVLDADPEFSKPDMEKAWVYLITCLRMDNRRDEAYKEAVNYLKRHPEDAEMQFLAGELVMEKRDWDKAAIHYRAVLRQPADGTPANAKLRRDAELALARVLSWSEDYYAAEKHYMALLEQSPEDAEVKREYARLLGWDRRYPQSLSLFRELVRENPDRPEFHEEMMFQQASYNKRWGAAIAHLQQWSMLEPDADGGDVWGTLAQSHWKQYQWDEAELAAERMFERKPGDQPTTNSLTHAWLVLSSWAVSGEAFFNWRKSNDEEGEHRDRKTDVSYSYLQAQAAKWVGKHAALRASVMEEWWNFGQYGDAPGGNADATRLSLGASWYNNPWINIHGDFGIRRFGASAAETGDKAQLLFDLSVNAALMDEAARATFYIRRHDAYDNWFNFRDTLYAIDFGVDTQWNYEKWITYAAIQDTVYNDNNNRLYLGVGQEYTYTDTGTDLLYFRGDIETWFWRYERPTYFSPDWYAQVALGVGGKHWFQRNPREWGSPERYITYGFTATVDRFKEIGASLRAGYHHDISERMSFDAFGEYGFGTAYSDARLWLRLTYLFGGGCREVCEKPSCPPAPRIRQAPKYEKAPECEPEKTRATPRYLLPPKREDDCVARAICPTGSCLVDRPPSPDCAPCQAAVRQLEAIRAARQYPGASVADFESPENAATPAAARTSSAGVAPRAYNRSGGWPQPARAATGSTLAPGFSPTLPGAASTSPAAPPPTASTPAPAYAPATAFTPAATAATSPSTLTSPDIAAPPWTAAPEAGAPVLNPSLDEYRINMPSSGTGAGGSLPPLERFAVPSPASFAPPVGDGGAPSPAAALVAPPSTMPALPSLQPGFTLPGETAPFRDLSTPAQVSPYSTGLPSPGTVLRPNGGASPAFPVPPPPPNPPAPPMTSPQPLPPPMAPADLQSTFGLLPSASAATPQAVSAPLPESPRREPPSPSAGSESDAANTWTLPADLLSAGVLGLGRGDDSSTARGLPAAMADAVIADAGRSAAPSPLLPGEEMSIAGPVPPPAAPWPLPAPAAQSAELPMPALPAGPAAPSIELPVATLSDAPAAPWPLAAPAAPSIELPMATLSDAPTTPWPLAAPAAPSIELPMATLSDAPATPWPLPAPAVPSIELPMAFLPSGSAASSAPMPAPPPAGGAEASDWPPSSRASAPVPPATAVQAALPERRMPVDTALSMSRSHGPRLDLGGETAAVAGPTGTAAAPAVAPAATAYRSAGVHAFP